MGFYLDRPSPHGQLQLLADGRIHSNGHREIHGAAGAEATHWVRPD